MVINRSRFAYEEHTAQSTDDSHDTVVRFAAIALNERLFFPLSDFRANMRQPFLFLSLFVVLANAQQRHTHTTRLILAQYF